MPSSVLLKNSCCFEDISDSCSTTAEQSSGRAAPRRLPTRLSGTCCVGACTIKAGPAASSAASSAADVFSERNHDPELFELCFAIFVDNLR